MCGLRDVPLNRRGRLITDSGQSADHRDPRPRPNRGRRVVIGRHLCSAFTLSSDVPILTRPPARGSIRDVDCRAICSENAADSTTGCGTRELMTTRSISCHGVSPDHDDSTDMPSRPGEFHPEPLTDPCVSLSTHTARATHEGCRLRPNNPAPPVAKHSGAGDLPPSLHGH